MKKYLLGILLFCCVISLYNNSTFAECTSMEIEQGTCNTTPDTTEQEKTACKATYSDPTCSSKYSCDTLEQDFTKANQCNYQRCLNVEKRLPSYCDCKYGPGGNGPGGIPLNTSLPFIGNCVTKSDGTAGDTAALDAFPTIVSVASRMLVTIILLVSFIMIIIGGVQWAQGDAKSGKAKITKVAIGFALLGMMGAILRLINPNFFK